MSSFSSIYLKQKQNKNLLWVHVSSHTKFWPDRFTRFDVVNKRTDRYYSTSKKHDVLLHFILEKIENIDSSPRLSPPAFPAPMPRVKYNQDSADIDYILP